MNRRIGIAALAAMLCCGVTSAQSEQIVYIDGVKYTAYTVAQGDTLYSLSKRYGVAIDTIESANPVLAEGLKAGQTIKIPHSTTSNKKQKQPKRSKKQFKSHTVRKGETLYSIARQYEISVATLMEDNADIDPAHLAIGQTLYIRNSQIGKTTELEVSAEIEEQKQIMNNVTVTEQYSYHVVHRGENAENIASRFGTTVDKLLSLNGFSEPNMVREGLIIKVPKPTSVTESQGEQSTTTEQESVQEEVKPLTFTTLAAGDRANVALMLPMSVNGKVSQNYLDFYQGFLLGADRLRMDGFQIHIDLFNTAHSNEKVAQIIESGKLDGANLIIGPVYEDTLIPVANYAEQRAIPVVSPLANLTQASNANIFQMSPRLESKYNKVSNLFDGSRRVVLISSDTVDSDFEAEVKQMLGDREYISHKYIYEHPSVIEKREKARQEGEEVPPSPSDLSPLLNAEQPSLFVITAATEVEVDRILAALASANISLKARSMTASPYVVFGNNKWNRYRNIDRSLFFSNNVIMLSTYHIDRSNPLIQAFSSQYVKAFDMLPSLYAYRGYDAAQIFIRSLYNKIKDGLNGENFSPLQTPYTFTKSENTNLHINEQWVRVNYNSNFTITAE